MYEHVEIHNARKKSYFHSLIIVIGNNSLPRFSVKAVLVLLCLRSGFIQVSDRIFLWDTFPVLSVCSISTEWLRFIRHKSIDAIASFSFSAASLRCCSFREYNLCVMSLPIRLYIITFKNELAARTFNSSLRPQHSNWQGSVAVSVTCDGGRRY